MQERLCGCGVVNELLGDLPSEGMSLSTLFFYIESVRRVELTDISGLVTEDPTHSVRKDIHWNLPDNNRIQGTHYEEPNLSTFATKLI